ncbi:putrescine aminopropyltransferase [Mycoemilia scoparia]|uniref:Putrescine aminopropyltransferase n=1 Tax=Mycoemilia scoparia TaxID=417184 RepID=A0A9W7ZWZ7_9FUNG|nr:putrescine aminopropyltransferase [Mycoemilia scoparia]
MSATAAANNATDSASTVPTALTHPNIKGAWFRETPQLWPGQAMSIEVNEILHVEKSKFQDVLVFQSKTYGNVLVLDGVIQCTERDEFSYQEMITHIPMMAHPNPKRVLVIGGGDGGVLREIVKHDCVEEAVLCDIDEAVIRVSQKYLPSMAVGFQHPKVKIHIGDGFQFLQDQLDTFDVIITDSSDPVGPAESLYQARYYELMKNALREGGIISTQGECQWLHLNIIKEVLDFARDLFPKVEYAYTTIPTYPSGQIGFVVCGKDGSVDLTRPNRRWSKEQEEKLCRYYNARIHEAAFVLPTFTRLALEGKTAADHHQKFLLPKKKQQEQEQTSQDNKEDEEDQQQQQQQQQKQD